MPVKLQIRNEACFVENRNAFHVMDPKQLRILQI